MTSEGVGGLLASLLLRVSEPYALLISPLALLIRPGSLWGSSIHAICGLIWALVVWSFFGGMISRMAAVQLAHSRRASLFQSFEFVAEQPLGFLVAPLCPLLGVAACLFAALPFGLIYWIPWVGPVLGGLFFVVPLGLGLVMTLMFAGLIAGWPLLPTALATGADDALDALSRTFSYLNQRLGFFFLMLVIACGVGMVGLLFVDTLARLVILAGRWSLSFTAPAAVLAAKLPVDLASGGVAPGFHGFWISAVRLVAAGWVYTYFWSAGAVIYLILRQDVDGTRWNDIDPPAPPSPD
jgi:hypothetical protein